MTKNNNALPLLMSYSDALIGLEQWPSVSANWQLLPDSTENASLRLNLNFDSTPFQGLLLASAIDATTLLVSFTAPLIANAANDVGNYRLDSGDVVGAILQADKCSVLLSVSALTPDNHFLLHVTNLCGVTGSLIAGQAGFSYPDQPALRSSNVQQAAMHGLKTFSQLQSQLTDPLGVQWAVETSLLEPQASGDKTALEFPASEVNTLLGWLFGSDSILTMLENVAAFNNTATLLLASHTLLLPLPLASLNSAQIIKLDLGMRISRMGGDVSEDAASDPEIRSTFSELAPLQIAVSTADHTHLVDTFAKDFTQALAPTGLQFSLAAGVDRMATADGNQTLWVVRVGVDKTNAISYAVNPTDANIPIIFAMRPISNSLQSQSQVPIYDYSTGLGFDEHSNRALSFVDIDCNIWERLLFEALDRTLSPSLTPSIKILGGLKDIDYLDQLLAVKDSIAQIAKYRMVPVFRDDTSDPSHAQEAFYQQLLMQLSDAYSVCASVGYTAMVNADISDPPPSLLGRVVANTLKAQVEQPSGLTLSSSKLELADSTDAPLVFLVTAASPVRDSEGAVAKSTNLDIRFLASEIEHQVGTPSLIPEERTSSRLRFVLPDQIAPLNSDLGPVTVPLVLRTCPMVPALIEHNAQTNDEATSLQALLSWTYTVTYALSFHYPQDRVYGSLVFNATTVKIPPVVEEPVGVLAQFVTVYPAVSKDLEQYLAGIDATTAPYKDKDIIKTASVALESAISLFKSFIQATNNGPKLNQSTSVADAENPLAFAFYIEEDAVNYAVTPGALRITLVGTLPQGLGQPYVEVDPQNYAPVALDTTDSERRSFVYRKLGTMPVQYLSAAEGQAIFNRKLVLPVANVLQRQSSFTSLYVKRNLELIPGRPSASAFVCKTREFSFSSPMFLLVDTEQLLDIEKMGPGEIDTVHIRSLDEHLQVLFDTLLAASEQISVTVAVQIAYCYLISSAIPPVQVPIMIQPPARTDVSNLPSLLSDWSLTIQRWLQNEIPSADGGALRFDLSLISDLTDKPLLRLRNLSLALTSISPAMS